jgi:signal recognition particle subunit SRP72
MEKIDIPQIYAQINESLKTEDHEKILTLSEKILKSNPKEKEAFQCKIIALINLGKNDEIIQQIEKSSSEREYLLEYAYALHEKKRYNDSITTLQSNFNHRKEISSSINELLAQNFYKLGNFSESYKIYKSIVEEKLKSDTEIDEEKDLISNFLAAYVLSDSREEEILKTILKYLNTWESFYNYCIISLKNGKFNESMETLYRLKRDYPQTEDEFNEIKNINLQLNIVQTAFEGFDYSKFTNVLEEYEKFFSSNKFPELTPYFYNNFLHVKKDKEAIHEILKKLDGFLKGESLFEYEKNKILENKIILLLRANRINEAQEIFKTLPQNFKDPIYLIIYLYIFFKLEKYEKLEELVKSDPNFKNTPESHLILLQIMLSQITSKNIEQFHFKVLNFIKEFYDYSTNFHFLNFFVGFYESRHLKEFLKEFIRNYKDPNTISKRLPQVFLKKSLALIGKSLEAVGMYEESSKFYSYILENVDRNDFEIKLNLINSISYFDTIRSDELRNGLDETMIDLSTEHISNLLGEVFVKFKKNPTEKKKSNKKKKKKIRYPKNFDPKKPGPMPDPERWLPKLQRKKFKNVAKNKMAYQGASTDNSTTTAQFGKR